MRNWIWGIEVLLFLAGVYFEPTHVVRGKLWGEAFFEGRPTSWWRCELERWEVDLADAVFRDAIEREPKMVPYFSRHSTWFERTRERWGPATNEHKLTLNLTRVWGPRLIHGEDDQAIPVLQTLLNDPSPKIRLMARIGLKLPADEIP